MTEIPTEPKEKQLDFDFCFWSKVMVAIPLFPLVALSVASQFESHLAQSIAAVVSIIIVVAVARKIDRIPLLQRKFRSKDS